MELRQLRYFSAVARHGTFTRAAEELHVTQSALSQQVKRLEEQLGVELLQRTAGGATVTSAGADLLARADAILAEAARARADMDAHAGLLRGVVRVAADAAAALALPAALASFHRAHGGIRIGLRQTAATEAGGLLRTGAVDLAVASLPAAAVPDGIRADALADEPLHAIAAPGDPLATAGELEVWALRERPFVLPEPGSALRELVTAACEQAGFGPVPLFELGDPAAVRQLVHAGLGVSLVPASWLAAPGAPVAVARLAPPVPRHRALLLASAAGAAPAAELLRAHLTAALGAVAAPPAQASEHG
ncbi:LysR family transcriptional regulator [Conexibacter sp. JD483]|uniref:LysR family transcriptional regulator n=1 Tax=unclassified Conexibacter TaxID=2627773 RepID=UPI002719A03E|nr:MULTISPECIES: LysR family transcriptional regulator [unclassified Conexibacter]MDO8189192.1 LysR family transcriptional regulator [Conexibacter sp. CPCC 205706]MDO8201925.1 LysR family transcriptional regulator [Conexibacter sp. CPCC 205762]MDR9371944.1 LysR family transcriptional regulator [Conexibacter sp. JD483]